MSLHSCRIRHIKKLTLFFVSATDLIHINVFICEAITEWGLYSHISCLLNHSQMAGHGERKYQSHQPSLLSSDFTLQDVTKYKSLFFIQGKFYKNWIANLVVWLILWKVLTLAEALPLLLVPMLAPLNLGPKENAWNCCCPHFSGWPFILLFLFDE